MKIPDGFIATCRCEMITGAMDYTRTDRIEAGKILGEWLITGHTVTPQYGNFQCQVNACKCNQKEVQS